MHDIFYFTDIHGCYDLYRAAMNYCIEQDPECNIIYGGDACDRGKDGYKIMRELLDNPRVGYLKGNHEDLFIHAAIEIQKDYKGSLDKDSIEDYLLDCEIQNTTSNTIQLSLYNGGASTLKEWMLDGMPDDIIEKLIHLPITFSYEHLDFCHAGGSYKTFLRVAEAEYNENWPDTHDEEELIWDRVYLGHGWAPNRTCIFGHTPTTHLAAKYYGRDKSLARIHPCAYVATLDDKWTGRKIAMDTGACCSGKLYVLNCLTMKAQGFYDANFAQNQNEQHKIEKIEVIQF